MISDASGVPDGSVLECDTCIVGGGPAGITVALALAESSEKVLLIESGQWKEDPQARDLLRGHVWPEGSHEELGENRRRQFGGSSVAWGGRCIPFDPIDFEYRPWIPNSGWPISAEEVSSYIEQATRICEVGRPVFDAAEAFPASQAEMIASFDGPDARSALLERWSPPTNFATRYGPTLRKAQNVTVLLGANALAFSIGSSDRKVESVQVAVAPSHRFVVKAARFVLACGGLENARFLLASKDVIAGGIGNETDRVGRYYMSHLAGIHAWARLNDPGRGFMYEFARDGDVYVRRRIWITPQAQHRERMGNAIACFATPFHHESISGYPLASATQLAKLAIGFRRKGRQARLTYLRDNGREILRHMNTVALGAPSLVPQVAEIVRQRYLSKRRLPILLPSKDMLKNRFELYYQAEHVPNPDSRVMLHPELDAFGMPRLEVRVAFSEQDVRTVLRLHAVIKEQFRKTATGDLVFDEEELEARVRDKLQNFNSAAHHLGTTRMADDPACGVVDRNCRVHGTENLFVAGSSVFPTSGHANPTLTIVALALRLARHIAGERGRLGHSSAGASERPPQADAGDRRVFSID